MLVSDWNVGSSLQQLQGDAEKELELKLGQTKKSGEEKRKKKSFKKRIFAAGF